VDDAASILDLFRDALGRAGFEVDTASTATDAMELLATRHYAAIVVDCSLADLPALDWLAAIRGAAPTTPMILSTGQIDDEELRRYAMEFRAAAVLVRHVAAIDMTRYTRSSTPREKSPTPGRERESTRRRRDQRCPRFVELLRR
jgi:DNA-binding response OmpR family regulator